MSSWLVLEKWRNPSIIKSFTAVLEPLRSELRWVIARIPFDVAKAWPVRRRLRVRGDIEGFAFRTSLFPFSSGDGHFLLVNKNMQAGAKATVGSKVRIRLEPDLEERAVVIPSGVGAGIERRPAAAQMVRRAERVHAQRGWQVGQRGEERRGPAKTRRTDGRVAAIDPRRRN